MFLKISTDDVIIEMVIDGGGFTVITCNSFLIFNNE